MTNIEPLSQRPAKKNPARSISIPKKKVQGEYITRYAGETLYNNRDPFTPTSGNQTAKYGLTALHPAVAPALKILEEGPFWSKWAFQPANDYEINPEYKVIDDKILSMLNYQVDKGFKYESFENVLRAIWRDKLIYGFSISEVNYKTKGGYHCLDNIKVHSPYLFDIYTDDFFEISKLSYNIWGQEVEKELLPEKFIVSTYPFVSHGNFYGESALKSIYSDVLVIEALEEAQADGARTLSMKPVIHHYVEGEDKTDEATLRSHLLDLENSDVLSLPGVDNEDGEVLKKELIEVMENRSDSEGLALISDMLEERYRRINRNLGLPDDLGFTQTNIGSLAKSNNEMDVYTQGIVSNQARLEEIVNRQIIPKMVQYNYPSLLEHPSYKLPCFRFETVEEDARGKLVDQMERMIASGIINMENPTHAKFVHESLDLPLVGPNEENDPGEEESEEEGSFMLRAKKKVLNFASALKKIILERVRG